MSTAPRSTPNLSLPSTQNTAPVFEFRCLYTHDLRQKKKRWQDGVLRFHTFNKRIMVYDVPRNYVGDTHWREDCPVQDGDELKLDKGVLIQVGEAMGSTEQDLTELLVKRRQNQDGSPARIATPKLSYPARSAGTPLTQLRPKSLNALLGIPRGQPGRATLPPRSPFEIRQAAKVQNAEDERPRKRQRMDIERLEKATPTTFRNREKRQIDAGVSNGTRISNGAMQRKPAVQEIITVDSDEESLMPSSPVVTQSLASPRQSAIEVHKRKPSPPKSNWVVPGPEVPSPSRKIATRSLRSPTGESPVASATAIMLQDNVDAVERPQNILRTASRRPRKRLMYRDLLPERAPLAVLSAIEDTSSKSTQKAHRQRRSAKGSEQADDLRVFRQNQQAQLDSRLQRFGGRGRQDDPESSPGFQSPVREHIPGPTRDMLASHPSDDASLGTAKQSTLPLQKSWHPPLGIQAEPSRAFITEDSRTDSLSLTQGSAKESDSAAELDRMDAILLAHPNRPVTANPKLSATKARNHLQHVDTTEVPSLMKGKPSQELPDPMLVPHPNMRSKPCTSHGSPAQGSIPLAPTQSLRQRSPFKKSLTECAKTAMPVATSSSKGAMQRSMSDLTPQCNLTAKKGVERNGSPTEEKDTDVGPWSREAFDLFGWQVGDPKTLVGKAVQS